MSSNISNANPIFIPVKDFFIKVGNFLPEGKTLKQYNNKSELVFQVATGALAFLKLGLENAPRAFSFVTPKLLFTLEATSYYFIFGLLTIPYKVLNLTNSQPFDSQLVELDSSVEAFKTELQTSIENGIVKGNILGIDVEQSDSTLSAHHLVGLNAKEVIDEASGLFVDYFKSFVKREIENKTIYKNKQEFLTAIKEQFVLDLGYNEDGFFLETLQAKHQQKDIKGLPQTFWIHKDAIESAIDNITFYFPTQTLGQVLGKVGTGLADLQLSLLALRDWKIIDTAKLAVKIAKHSGQKWLEETHLKVVIGITVVATSTFKFYDSCSQLWENFGCISSLDPTDQALLLKERKAIYWELFSSGADLLDSSLELLNHYNYLHSSNNVLNIATLIARSLNAGRILAGY